MARKSKKLRNPSKGGNRTPTAGANPDRRQILRLVRNVAVAAGGVGAIGYLARNSFQAFAAEQDLSRLGQGKPAVVQIHDPTCSICTALQKETRQALSQFGECDMLFLVADIKQAAGSAFANKFGVPHVTLLLFDGEGELRQTLRGMRYDDELAITFAQHHSRYSKDI